ncbi:hypothetical protein KQX54_015303 [Cotesia glomerata]|uniref:Uncharacterized protein n=1 Tax=Cotesia glomerata TaxID=32391 RepID=A0AAV7J9Q6_COTGL|nr:hypothetical protein KQX54_015303 [Cotesia glomerata]
MTINITLYGLQETVLTVPYKSTITTYNRTITQFCIIPQGILVSSVDKDQRRDRRLIGEIPSTSGTRFGPISTYNASTPAARSSALPNIVEYIPSSGNSTSSSGNVDELVARTNVLIDSMNRDLARTRQMVRETARDDPQFNERLFTLDRMVRESRQLRERQQLLQEQYNRLGQERDQIMQEQDLQAHQQREQELRAQLQREQKLRTQLQREQELREQEVRAQRIREQERREQRTYIISPRIDSTGANYSPGSSDWEA